MHICDTARELSCNISCSFAGHVLKVLLQKNERKRKEKKGEMKKKTGPGKVRVSEAMKWGNCALSNCELLHGL